MIHHLWLRTVKRVIRLLMRLLTDTRVMGLDNLPQEPPFILVTNHLHMIDPGIIYGCIPFEEIVVLAADKWERNPLASPLLKSIGVIFIKRGEVDRKALSACIRTLQSGKILGLAPEGTRSRVRQLQQGKPGVAFLAAKTNAQLVLFGMSGQEKTADCWLHFRKVRITVRIGKPFRMEALSGQDHVKELEKLTEELMCKLAGLLEPSVRGIYADCADMDFARESGVWPAIG